VVVRVYIHQLKDYAIVELGTGVVMGRHKVVYVIIAQLSFGFFFSCLVVSRLHNVVPSSWNASTWSDFSEKVSEKFHISSSSHKLLLLMTLHTGHMYCYLPLFHVTKILYGYWLGIWAGLSVCVLWECWLLLVFLYFLEENPRHGIQRYVTEIRQNGTFVLQISAVCFSGLPLQTKTMLVSYSDVSKYEYFGPSVVVIFVLSLKNVACGAVLADEPSPRTIAVVAGCIAFLLVLSTLTTVIVSSQTLFVVLTDEAQDQATSIHTTGEENVRCATNYKRIQKSKPEKNIRMASPVTDESTDDELTIMTV